MKKALSIILFACVVGCKHSKYSSEAISLNNEAVAMWNLPNGPEKRTLILKKAVALEDQAIKIDSNYPLAYSSKLTFQHDLKDYKGMVATAKHFVKFFPVIPDANIEIGIAFEKTGDTTEARKQFYESLLVLNKTLDTMNVNRWDYKYLVMKKALDLVYLNQEQKGYKLIKELDDKENNKGLKHAYQKFMKTSRAN